MTALFWELYSFLPFKFYYIGNSSHIIHRIFPNIKMDVNLDLCNSTRHRL
jgi:hypothetical protein